MSCIYIILKQFNIFGHIVFCFRGHCSGSNGLTVVTWPSPRAAIQSECTMSSVMVAHSDHTNEYNNNNNHNHALLLNNNEASPEELALLAKLEEANRYVYVHVTTNNREINKLLHKDISSLNVYHVCIYLIGCI